MSAKKPNRNASLLSSVDVRQSGVHGLGVFAARDLRSGERIGGYAGRRYGSDLGKDFWDNQLTYLFGLSDGTVIDGGQGGNATRHINHACEPNVEAVELERARGGLGLDIVALRDIRAGEEVFLDYALDIDGGDPSEYPCRCASTCCRGTLAAVP